MPPPAHTEVAANTPAPATLPGPVDETKVRTLLAKGRTAASKRDLVTAIAAFIEARQLSPSDPDVLSELGLAQFQGGQLADARTTTNQALKAARTDAQSAASAYNLGRIEEAAGNEAEAVRAYTLSVAKRPSRGVDERRQAVERRLQAGKVIPLNGPYASMDELCAALGKIQIKPYKGPNDHPDFACPKLELKRLSAGLPPPLAELRVFWTRVRLRPEEVPPREPGQPDDLKPEDWQGMPRVGYVNAAIRIDKTWYAASELAINYVQNHIDGSVKLESTTVERVGKAGTPLIVLRFAEQGEGRFSKDSSKSVVVLGAGPSGRPSVIGPITTNTSEQSETNPKLLEDEGENEQVQESTDYDWQFQDGSLVLTGKTTKNDRGARQNHSHTNLNTRYSLAMP